jgi:hypothetical protein
MMDCPLTNQGPSCLRSELARKVHAANQISVDLSLSLSRPITRGPSARRDMQRLGLKLEYNMPLSNFAFSFNLRR